ncbi:Nucleoside transporter [Paragonimus heterotremus]|uniref:Nucleoside transporter n=1 Tax=Paragonimus heterotremus TaxID=100268 RepID=A0A8J4SQH9_9TREM|nr:Nucleoside transporter [Paragonimus heterotremus]
MVDVKLKGGSSDTIRTNIDEFSNTPRDKFNLVYLIFFFTGVGTLLPWNFFITAIPVRQLFLNHCLQYFQFKLRNTSLENGSLTDPKQLSKEQVLFGNYLALCSMLPFATFTIMNLVLMKWISSFTRYIIGAVTVFVLFLVTVILVKIVLEPTVFLGITLASVVVINSGSAIVQGSVFGIAALLPPRNMKACLEGQALAGVLAAIAQIASIAGSPRPTDSALAYFLIALTFLAVATCLFLLLKRNTYFSYFWNARNNTQSVKPSSLEDVEQDEIDAHQPMIVSDRFRIAQSLKDVWVHGLSVWSVFLVTLTMFPALLQPVRSKYYSEKDPWTGKFFTPVIVFLSFNVFDWIGRALAGVIKWPRLRQKWLLMGICLARAVLIVLGLFLNQQPRARLPVVFLHDAFPIIYVIILGLTNGYLATLCLMYGPSFASPGNSEGAGVALSIYLALGLCCGVALSTGLAYAVLATAT